MSRPTSPRPTPRSIGHYKLVGAMRHNSPTHDTCKVFQSASLMDNQSHFYQSDQAAESLIHPLTWRISCSRVLYSPPKVSLVETLRNILLDEPKKSTNSQAQTANSTSALFTVEKLRRSKTTGTTRCQLRVHLLEGLGPRVKVQWAGDLHHGLEHTREGPLRQEHHRLLLPPSAHPLILPLPVEHKAVQEASSPDVLPPPCPGTCRPVP